MMERRMTDDGPGTTNILRKGDDIAERLLDFSVKSLELSFGLPKNDAWRHIADQLVRSATAGGANYEEARGSETRADFIYKVSLAKKEVREALYWLRLVQRVSSSKSKVADELISEANSLVAILAKSVKTARENAKKNRRRK